MSKKRSHITQRADLALDLWEKVTDRGFPAVALSPHGTMGPARVQGYESWATFCNFARRTHLEEARAAVLLLPRAARVEVDPLAQACLQPDVKQHLRLLLVDAYSMGAYERQTRGRYPTPEESAGYADGVLHDIMAGLPAATSTKRSL